MATKQRTPREVQNLRGQREGLLFAALGQELKGVFAEAPNLRSIQVKRRLPTSSKALSAG